MDLSFAVDLFVPEWLVNVLGIAAAIVAYVSIGIVTYAIAIRCDGESEAAGEMGTIWPVILALVLVYGVFLATWWTVLLPARGIAWLITKKDKS